MLMESSAAILFILFVGVLTVVGGVLIFRLHAFLALVLGALIVGALTPRSAIERTAIEKVAISILESDLDRNRCTLDIAAQAGEVFVVLRDHLDTAALTPVAELRVDPRPDSTSDQDQAPSSSSATIISSNNEVSISTEDLVVSQQAYVAVKKAARENVGERVAFAFGNTCAKIGILIAMASIIGKCMLDSGAADRIVRSSLRVLGQDRAPKAFLASGFLLGIPVFFDTVFYLMIPLAKAMRMRTGHSYLLYVLTIVAGGTMAHSLVPPTPGPLFVAEQLNVEIGTMMLAGCIVGLFTASGGYAFAVWVARRWELPLRESPDFSMDELEALSKHDDCELPPLGLALLPITLPVLLIGGLTVAKLFSTSIPIGFMSAATVLGNKNIALIIAAAIAMAMLAMQKRTSPKQLAAATQAALSGGGVIILITAAGGAFGGVLQQTGVAGLIRDHPSGSPALIISIAFFITAAIRTAQGSATVAMITAVGILSGIADSNALGFHPVYIALAIGCGSKLFAWMNDSGFWVVGRMSGMTEVETLKYVTPMMALMGLVGWIVLMISATLFPMA
jgi:GntP family gluconate:H+ symporter